MAFGIVGGGPILFGPMIIVTNLNRAMMPMDRTIQMQAGTHKNPAWL